MPNTSLLLHYYTITHRRFTPPFRPFFFIPTSLALFTSLFILFYISTTSTLFFTPHFPSSLHLNPLIPSGSSSFAPKSTLPAPFFNGDPNPLGDFPNSGSSDGNGSQRPSFPHLGLNGIVMDNEVFYDKDIFLEDYKTMNRCFKIYVYPHRGKDLFSRALLPVDFEHGGNYASESYFKKVLMKSHFITNDPAKADLFFMPFSIAKLRHDHRIGVGGIQDFFRGYVFNISRKYPYWNKTGGADHFCVACHSVGRSAMEEAEEVKFNAIQIFCSSRYFVSGYVLHKDASLPRIWPRPGHPPYVASSERKKLAFFAGPINSPVREKLLQVWRNDSEISVHFGQHATLYADKLLRSKFCLHVKGFEVNTAHVADSLYYGCVPVIVAANHYDLPFADILNWKSFSIVIATLDIPLLKNVLREVSSDQYVVLRNNVLKVRKHFRWHDPPVDYDAFYMVMYELWLRRTSVRIPLNTSANPS